MYEKPYVLSDTKEFQTCLDADTYTEKKKIHLIKNVRKLTGFSLETSKAIVDLTMYARISHEGFQYGLFVGYMITQIRGKLNKKMAVSSEDFDHFVRGLFKEAYSLLYQKHPLPQSTKEAEELEFLAGGPAYVLALIEDISRLQEFNGIMTLEELEEEQRRLARQEELSTIATTFD